LTNALIRFESFFRSIFILAGKAHWFKGPLNCRTLVPNLFGTKLCATGWWFDCVGLIVVWLVGPCTQMRGHFSVLSANQVHSQSVSDSICG
jgi:hypothetical protein